MWTRRRSDLLLLAAVALAPARALAAPPPAQAAPPAAPDDPLSEYRERFKLGMDRYRAGALAEAIGYWEPVYRELGEQRGYRLAYDLGVAYAELGDATHAAERLGSFLAEVDARRARGESIAPIVQKEEEDARARAAALTATKGRIRIDAGSPPRAAAVDANEPRLAGFVAYVAPGEHTVTFAPGTPDAESKTVQVQPGQIVEVAPSPPAPAPASPAAPPALGASAGATGAAAPSSAAPAPPPTTYLRRETEHPFSLALPGLTGGLAAAAAIVAIPLDNHAWWLHDRYAAEQQNSLSIPQGDRQSFENARTWAYVTVGAAVGLGIATVALASWYFLGTTTREVTTTPAGVAGRF
jgi:hypothetical protein